MKCIGLHQIFTIVFLLYPSLRAEEIARIYDKAHNVARIVNRQLTQLERADKEVNAQKALLQKVEQDENADQSVEDAIGDKLDDLTFTANSRLRAIRFTLVEQYLPNKLILDHLSEQAKQLVENGEKKSTTGISIAIPILDQLEDWLEELEETLSKETVIKTLKRGEKELKKELEATTKAIEKLEGKKPEEEIESDVTLEEEDDLSETEEEEPTEETSELAAAEVKTAGQPPPPTLEVE